MDKSNENMGQVSIDETADEATEADCMKWGLPLAEIYKLSLKFYKGKNFLINFVSSFHVFCLHFRQIG